MRLSMIEIEILKFYFISDHEYGSFAMSLESSLHLYCWQMSGLTTFPPSLNKSQTHENQLITNLLLD